MDRVEEIEAAIHDLPPDDYRRLAEWFREFEERRWDAQMDEDSSARRLESAYYNPGRQPGDRMGMNLRRCT